MTTATAGEKTRARRACIAGSEEPNGRLLAAEGSRPLSSSPPLPRQRHAPTAVRWTQTREAGSVKPTEHRRPHVSCSADRARLSQERWQARGLAVRACMLTGMAWARAPRLMAMARRRYDRCRREMPVLRLLSRGGPTSFCAAFVSV